MTVYKAFKDSFRKDGDLSAGEKKTPLSRMQKPTELRQYKQLSAISRLRHGLWVFLGSLALTFLFFFILPLMQTICKPPETDLTIQSVDTANIPPPPPPPEQQEEEKPEQEEKLPELVEEAPPLDLNQLELALNPGFSDSWMGGDFTVKLNTVAGGQTDDIDALFSMADLDQKPRVIYQPGPTMTAEIRKKAPGTVYILFIVDKNGRVENPMVQKSTDPIFDKAALTAVKQWKFEPGKRNGQAVRFRMRVPISFPKG